jgi:hypothetical protein
MIEVAIAAVNTVFDWKSYLRENFPETEIPEVDEFQVKVTILEDEDVSDRSEEA